MPYLNTQEAEDQVELLALTHPALCQRLTLGHATHEGRISHALSIRTGPRNPRACVYLIGCVHAREWGSADILLFLADALLASYTNGTDVVLLGKTYTAAQVRTILERIELLIFPVVNPDGRTHSQTTVPMWRKNRAPTPTAGTLGIDINRNYEFLWDYRTHFLPGYSPASDDPTWETYHGTAAWSEAETRNVRELVDARPYTRIFVDVHSQGQLLLYPWGDDAPQTATPTQHFRNAAFDGMRGNTSDATYREYIVPVDQARYQAVTQRLNGALGQVRGKVYTPGPGATTLYIVSGSSKDYMYARHIADPAKRKIDAYLFEWGQQFQPPFAEMSNIILDVSAALIELCLVAQDLPLVDATPDPLDFRNVRTGTTKTAFVTIRNRGVGSVELVNVAASGAGFGSAVATLGPIAEGASAQLPVTFTPPAAGAASGLVAFEFRQPGGALVDRAEVRLAATGCTLGAKACAAPVFGPINIIVCILMWIVAPIVLALLALFSWIPGVRCAIRQYTFRLSNCLTGNDDPCRAL